MSTDGNDYIGGKVKELETKIENVENICRYQFVIGCADIESIINYTDEQLSKLTPEECDTNQYLCIQYLIELQKKLNKAKTIKNWANENLNIVVAKEYNNYKSDKYTPHDIVKYNVISGNIYAKKLHEIIQDNEVVISSLYDITKHIGTMINTFKCLSYSKKGENVAYREN